MKRRRLSTLIAASSTIGEDEELEALVLKTTNFGFGFGFGFGLTEKGRMVLRLGSLGSEGSETVQWMEAIEILENRVRLKAAIWTGLLHTLLQIISYLLISVCLYHTTPPLAQFFRKRIFFFFFAFLRLNYNDSSWL